MHAVQKIDGKIWQGSTPCISGFTTATSMGQTPTVRQILGLELKQL